MDLFFLALILTNVRFEWHFWRDDDDKPGRPRFLKTTRRLSDWEEPIQAPLKSLESQDFKICPESCNRT